MVSVFLFKAGLSVWGLLLVVGSSCKTGQNAVRFCFLLFAWVRSVLGMGLKKGTKNRTERTLGCSGRNSAPLCCMVFYKSEGTIQNSEGSLLCYGWFLRVLFL